MSEEKTHYRKAFNSPYLSSQDVVEPVVLTIGHVALEGDKTKKTKDLFNTAYFLEKEIRPGETLKPMILNAVNSRAMKEMTGSHFIEDWRNVKVMVFVDHNVRFGKDTVEGLRITNAPARQELRPEDKAKWQRAIQSYRDTGNLSAVLKHMDISEANQSLIIKEAEAA